MTSLVIVESPSKAKTINKYLGSEYEVIASYGHIRDLPSKEGSVLPEKDFELIYTITEKAEKHVKNIAASFKRADTIFLATDPDREGEAISWHIIEAMREKKALKKNAIIKRVIFNEITKKAVVAAMANPLEINADLVNAQQARRALDYLFGFTLSPVLWRKLPGSKSAGRVQSVALRMICEREDEIERFVSKEYWTVALNFTTKNNAKLTTYLTHIDGKKLDKFEWKNEEEVKSSIKDIEKLKYKIANIENKQSKRNPAPPFITSSLQQEAARKLGFSAKYTMQVAQKLYEGMDVDGQTVGLITYMRTDGVQLSADALEASRNYIDKEFGKDYLPKEPRIYKSSSKSAQEAHEAIRPTHIEYTPKKLANSLDKDQLRLYELIWKRTIASQMENAIIAQVAITVMSEDEKITSRATGSTIFFDGFYKLYREGKDDQKEEEENSLLPKVTIGEAVKLEDIKKDQHFTEASPRFSEASLVKKLEELGIGRPSTYASTISVLQDREYVKLVSKRFVPEERGRIVSAFLVSFFNKYIEYDFTASLEDQLDNVSNGKLPWKDLLKDFWFNFEENAIKIKNLDPNTILTSINEELDVHFFPKGDESKICPLCKSGKLSIKIGKYGVFAACSDYPECKFTKSLTGEMQSDEGGNDNNENLQNNLTLGIDPDTNLNIYLKKGPYGYYVQLGEDAKGKEKPKRSPIPNFIEVQNLNFDTAKKLLTLPKELGINPETNQKVNIGIGKFGPYILHNGSYTSLEKNESFLDIELKNAIELISNAKTVPAKNQKIKELGMHPKENLPIEVFQGRYGPYIKYNGKNIPVNASKLESLNLEEAIDIISNYKGKKPTKK